MMSQNLKNAPESGSEKQAAPAKMQHDSIKKNFTFSTLYQLLAVMIPFVTAPYIARVIGDYGVGVYSYTASVEAYFTMFASLGTVSYGRREIARHRDDPQKRSQIFWEIELLSVITSCICVAAWMVVILFSSEYKLCYLILSFNILNAMFDISWLYTGLEEVKYTVRQNAIFKILGVVLLFALVKGPEDLLLYMGIMVVTNFLGTATMWIYLPRYIGKPCPNVKNLPKHFKETMIYFVPAAAISIYTMLDKSLIQWITRDPYENGYYEQATKVVNMVKSITFLSLNTIVSARISYLFAGEHMQEIKKKIGDSINYILFMGIGCTFGLIACAEEFVPVFFGSGYEPAIPMLQLLSPVVVVIGISNCLENQYFIPAGLRAKSARFLIAGAALNLCMNLLLIPRLGGIGAIIGTLAAETLITVLFMIYCERFLTVKQLLYYGWKKLAAGALMLLVILLLKRAISSMAVLLVTEIIVGVAVYGIVLLVLRDPFMELFSRVMLKRRRKRS